MLRRGERKTEAPSATSHEKHIGNNNKDGGPAAPVHKPQAPRPPKTELGEDRVFASLNIQGSKIGGKRNKIEAHTKSENVDILAEQETHLGEATRENRKNTAGNCTWYFSGGRTWPTHHRRR